MPWLLLLLMLLMHHAAAYVEARLVLHGGLGSMAAH